MYNTLVKKFLSFSIGNWIGMFISLLTTPIVTRLFHPEDFGKYSIYLLSVNILVIISLMGTDQSYMRYYDDINQKKEYLIKCAKISFFAFLFVSIILFLFSNKISYFLFSEEITSLIFLIVINILISLINRFLLTNVRMQQKGKLYSLFSILSRLFEFSFILALFNLGSKNYQALIYASIFSNALITIILLISHTNFIKENHQKESLGLPSNKKILDYGIPFTFSLIIFWLFDSVDKLALKTYSSLDEVGLYAAAMKVVGILIILQSSFQSFWTPVVFEKMKHETKNVSFFQNVHIVVGFIMLMIGVVLIMFSDLISYMLGSNYREASNIFPFLFLIPIMYTVSETTVIGINYKNKTKWHIVIALISCAVNVFGNYLLVPNYGAVGAAISTGFSYIVFYCLRTFISQKMLQIKFGSNSFYFGTMTLVTYAFIATYNSYSYLHILLGIFSIILITIFYKKSLKKIYINKNRDLSL